MPKPKRYVKITKRRPCRFRNRNLVYVAITADGTATEVWRLKNHHPRDLIVHPGLGVWQVNGVVRRIGTTRDLGDNSPGVLGVFDNRRVRHIKAMISAMYWPGFGPALYPQRRGK